MPNDGDNQVIDEESSVGGFGVRFWCRLMKRIGEGKIRIVRGCLGIIQAYE
jgi:hypothetical protein